MNTLNEFTIKSLKLNKKRTIVTIIGILLSVALICAVAGIVESFRVSIIKTEIEDGGKYHTLFRDVKKENIDIVKNNKKIESYYYTENVGYSEFNTTNEKKPYLYLINFNDMAFRDSALKLVEGRFPESENEIVLTKEVNRYAMDNYKIGDFINLDLFEINLINKDYEAPNYFDKSNEEHVQLFKKEYKIVGFVDNIHYAVDSFHEKGISVITYSNNPTQNINVFVMYKEAKFVNTEDKILAQAFEINPINNVLNNRELLRWSGVFSQETLITLYTIVGIVMGIIMFTSIFVIRNSFAISIVERNKEYGILASIGATKKQIKKSVLFEGLCLGIIAIPLGIIIGLGAIFILIFIVNILIGNASKIEFLYIIPYQAILLSIILGTITIYLSCYFTARKTSKIAPIDSIRNSEDIKVKKNKIKTPSIIKKVFKTGGVIAYKNLQRNKKKYRTTVISMVVSIVLFLTIASFTSYIFKESIKEFYTMDFNMMITYDSENKDFYTYANTIEKSIGNDKSAIVKAKVIDIDNKYMNFDFAEYRGFGKDEKNTITLIAVGERAYKDYIKKIGGKYEDYKDKGILVDNLKMSINGKLEYISLYKINNNLEVKINNEVINLEIAQNTKLTPMSFAEGAGSYIVISDEMIEKFGYDIKEGFMVIESTNPDELLNTVKNLSDELYVNNYIEAKKQTENIFLMISIFLYGFISVIIVISITNIINTLTTSINLRKREFAMLKAIGTTSKEFKQMINLESIFLGIRVLIIGVPIGMGISYGLYYAIHNLNGVTVKYNPNILHIISVIIVVFSIVKIIMTYSIKKINKQNIIETIRNNNI